MKHPFRSTLAAFASAAILSACAATPAAPPTPRPAPAPPTQAAAAPAPAQDRVVYAYPLQNQSEELQERDRYECHRWAVKQSGFDPSTPSRTARPTVRVVSSPPPSAIPGTAIAGAVLGAVIGGPRNAGEGAVVGAVTGAAVGAATDSTRDEQVRERDERTTAVRRDRDAAVDERADGYRRAISACLGGRGYSTQ